MSIVCPSIICADFLNIQQELNELKNAGIKQLHIDVMDGVFVPQITIGQLFTKQCKIATKMLLDIHLMVVSPERQIDSFVNAGADSITFHYEATNKHIEILQQIRNKNVKCGIALQPDTDIFVLEDIFESIIPDKVLIMSVVAGKSGQAFIESSVEKVKKLDKWLKEKHLRENVKIEIDGGINIETANKVKDFVDEFVVGSALFVKKDQERVKFIKDFQDII